MAGSRAYYVILSRPSRDASGRTRAAGSVLRMHEGAARAYRHRGEVERMFPVADDYAVTTPKGVVIVTASEALVMAKDRRTGDIAPFDESTVIGDEPGDKPKRGRRKAKADEGDALIGDE